MKKLYLILPLALVLCFMVGCQQQGEQAAERTTSDELVPLDLKDAHGSKLYLLEIQKVLTGCFLMM